MHRKVVPTVRVFQHVPSEGPGRVAAIAEERGLTVDVLRIDRGETVPDELAPEDILIVMGGPMGVGDVEDPKYPFLAAEIELLRKRIADDAPTLGICLGSQLLAHATGARVYPNLRSDSHGPPRHVVELGWGPVRILRAESERALAGLRGEEQMLHWHGDTFDLPSGAVRLAETDLCANQAFRLGRRIFGLQFHCEVDAQMVAEWVACDAAYVSRALGPRGAQWVLDETARLFPAQQEVGDRLLRNLFACLLT